MRTRSHTLQLCIKWVLGGSVIELVLVVAAAIGAALFSHEGVLGSYPVVFLLLSVLSAFTLGFAEEVLFRKLSSALFQEHSMEKRSSLQALFHTIGWWFVMMTFMSFLVSTLIDYPDPFKWSYLPRTLVGYLPIYFLGGCLGCLVAYPSLFTKPTALRAHAKQILISGIARASQVFVWLLLLTALWSGDDQTDVIAFFTAALLGGFAYSAIKLVALIRPTSD